MSNVRQAFREFTPPCQPASDIVSGVGNGTEVWMKSEFPARRFAPANANQVFDGASRDPRAARDVPPGKPWVFDDHRTLAEVFAEEAQR